MKLVKGPSILVRHPRTPGTWIFVPGTWHAQMPTVTSHEAATEIVQRVFESGYMRGLRDAMARRARDYARLFPELCEPAELPKTRKKIVTLRGFDPGALQATFVPFEKVGSHGKHVYVAELEKMGERAIKEL
jgi:hypothetical protein